VHPKFQTPWVNTVVVGVLACAAAGFMSLDKLADLSNVGALTAFGVVCATVIYLRFTSPDLARPFRVPLYPVVPILGVLMCGLLLLTLMRTEHTRNFFLGYLVIGILVYFVYSMRSSKLGKGVLVSGHEAEPMELPHKDN
jgi:APA family basic amino acid/polyamine antiporter